MDETSSSSSSRTKSDVVEVDRISTMPCSIIHHILSFVPTKDAVRTSVLSTRWKDIWIGTPVVDIRSSWRDVTETSTINHLMNFMDKLLLAHDGHNIDKFHVSFFNFYCDPARIVSWITTLLAQHKVKILELFFSRRDDFDGTFSFPRSYFTSLESLTEMSIHLWSKAEMEISVCLNLKVLHLCDVVLFCDDHLTQESSFTFPNLEEFALDSCYWENTKKTIRIHAPRLRALIIQDESDDQWDEKQKIEFYAASLTSFTINGDLLPKYYLCDLSRLDNAYVDIFYCGPSEDYVLKFLRDVFNVRNLTVTSTTINTFCNAFQSVDLPTFPNMTSLNVHELYGSISYNFRKFLCMFPNIESLHFQDGIGQFFSQEDDEVVAAMFSFIPLNLKAIEVEMFHGDKHELFLIELLLKNARVLERMTIRYSEALLADGEKLMEVTMRLVMFPRRSIFCVVDSPRIFD